MSTIWSVRKTAGLAALLVLSCTAGVTSSEGQNVSSPTGGPTSVPAAADGTRTVSTAPLATGDAQILRERAAAFWLARFAGNSQGQWELLEPRGRGRLTAQEYAPAIDGSGRYLAYEVGDATVNGYFATVKVRVLFQPILPSGHRIAPSAVVIDDRWVKIGGVWYRTMDDDGQGPPQGARP